MAAPAHRLPFPICKEQQEQIARYTDPGLKGKVSRVVEFYFSDREKEVHFEEIAYRGARFGAAAGAGGGAILGVGAVLVLNPPTGVAATIYSTLIGLFGGAAAGAAVGAGVGTSLGLTAQLVINLEGGGSYEEWRQRAVREKVFGLYQRAITQEHDLAEFMCPITRDLISDPVLAEDGRIYERRHIVSWIRRIEAQAAQAPAAQRAEILQNTSPERIMRISVDKLKYADRYYGRVCGRVKELLDQEIDPVVAQGLQRYVESVQEPALAIHERLVLAYNRLMVQGRITQEECAARINEVNNHYGPFFQRRVA
jgi:hypothetical protein